MPNVAPESLPGDAHGILSQVFAEEAAAYEEMATVAKSASKNTSTGDEKPAEPNGEESSKPNEDEPPKPTEGEEAAKDGEPEKPGKPEDGAPAEGKPKEPSPEESAEKKPAEEKSAETKLRIGKKEFGSVEDAISEATRLIGHNANLAGQISELQTEVGNHKGAAQQVSQQLQEALKANQQWQEWYEKNQNGEDATVPAKPAVDVEAIVKKALAEARQAESREAQEKAMATEVERIQAFSNYHEVSSLIYQIADKINPITGKPFQPLEAYKFACRELGVKDETIEAPKPQTPSAPPKPEINPAAQRAAARPTSTHTARTITPKPAKDEEDEMLGRAFPLL